MASKRKLQAEIDYWRKRANQWREKHDQLQEVSAMHNRAMDAWRKRALAAEAQLEEWRMASSMSPEEYLKHIRNTSYNLKDANSPNN